MSGGICIRVKICGITTADDALCTEEAGADAIGVVMYSTSKRSISKQRAAEIFSVLGPFTTRVVVSHTHDERDLADILTLHPNAIQISHPFTFDWDSNVKVIRAIGRGDKIPEYCDAIVVDDSQGSGKRFDLSFARDVVRRSRVPVILAGGLNPSNVKDAISHVRPYAVDVASGVEVSPGVKDPVKVKAFVEACRER